MTVDSLSSKSLVELEIGYADADPCEQSGYSCEVLEPLKNSV